MKLTKETLKQLIKEAVQGYHSGVIVKGQSPADSPIDPHNIVGTSADAIFKVRDILRQSPALSKLAKEPEDWKDYGYSKEEVLEEIGEVTKALKAALRAVRVVTDLVKDKKSGV